MSAKVNKPVDPKAKEADVNRKLQLYGIISAFQNGKVPSNDQIDVALNSFLNQKFLSSPHEKLSADGKTLVTDVREVVQQAKYLLLSKNEGNLLQDFIWQTQQFDPKAVSVPGAPVDKETAKKHGDQTLQGLRTLGTLIITNGQFRKLLQDATVLFRDMAADAASTAAERVRPSGQELDNMDRPADDNTWHDAPDFSKDNLKKQAQGVYKGNPAQDAKDVLGAGTQSAHPTGSQDPKDLAATAARDQQQGTSSGVDARGGASAGLGALKQKYNENVDDDTKEKVKQRNDEYRRRTKEYFNKKMPQERKEQIVWRLKKLVLECQQHPDYAQAIETLLDLADEYKGHTSSLAQGGTGTVKEARSGFDQAERSLRTLIERFANGTSTEDLWSSINQIYQDADRDRELKDWFKAMDRYVRRCLLEQGYILDDESNHEWNRLYDHGRYLLREKYRSHTDRIFGEIRFLTEQFDEDPQNKRFGQAVQKLFLDLGNDDNGKPTFKPHLVKDLTEVILPSLFEGIAYVPIPRLEFSDHQVDVVIENLILESDNFMPNILEINSEHHFRWGRKKIANKNKQVIDVKISGVQLDLRDVSYYIKRKQGFPSLTDTGVADILLPGDGFSFKIKLSTADAKDSQNFFKIEKVDVDIKQMNVKLTKSNHKFLFALVKPIMLRVLRPALQKVFEKTLKDNLNKFDQFLYQIKKEADRAQQEVINDPQNAPNVYKRYANAAQKRYLQGKKKAEEVAADKKVNVAMTKEDSIFPNISLPGGISTKATEYKELARKGETWESPVFSIGAAQKSSDIPHPPKIERKPHSTGTGSNGHAGNGALNGGPNSRSLNGNNYSSGNTFSSGAVAGGNNLGTGLPASGVPASGVPASGVPAAGNLAGGQRTGAAPGQY